MYGSVHDPTTNLPDGASAHHHDEVTVSANRFQLFHDRPEGVDVHRRRSMISQSFNEISRGDQTSLFLAVSDEVDSWHEYQVCLGETMCKLFEEETGSTVLVWLEDADQPQWFFGSSQRPQGRFALAGMVAVVVEHPCLPTIGGRHLPEELHSSIDPFEIFEGVGDSIPRRTEPVGEDARGGSVQGVVVAREFGIPLGDEGPAVEDADPAGVRVEEDLKIGGR